MGKFLDILDFRLDAWIEIDLYFTQYVPNDEYNQSIGD